MALVQAGSGCRQPSLQIARLIAQPLSTNYGATLRHGQGGAKSRFGAAGLPDHRAIGNVETTGDGGSKKVNR